MIVNLIDVDGTLCPSLFTNDRLCGDNKNCLTPEFLKDLAEVVPYEWWCPPNETCMTQDDKGHWAPSRESEMWAGQVCILVTGRLPQHEELTVKWFGKHCADYEDAPLEVSFVSVPWDDTCESREASYKKYVDVKSWKLCNLIMGWLNVLDNCNIKNEIHVYEDDEHVLHDMLEHLKWRYVGDYFPSALIHVHLVDKSGEVHDYP